MKRRFYFNQFYIKHEDGKKIIVFIDSISEREHTIEHPAFYIKKENSSFFVYAYLSDRNTKIINDKLFYNEESAYEFHDHISNQAF